MLVKTKGIIFKSVRYRETSLILEIYTRELGLRSYIISGVRKPRASTGAALLQLMSIVDLVVYDKENKDLNRIREVKHGLIYRRLYFEIQRSSIGLFMLEMSRKCIREKESNPGLFDFLERAFSFLDHSQSSVSSYHLSFLVHLAERLGIGPENSYSDTRPFFDMREGVFTEEVPFHRDYMKSAESKALNELMSIEPEDSHTVPLNRILRNQLLDDLVSYFRIHLGEFGPVRSLEIYRDIFRE